MWSTVLAALLAAWIVWGSADAALAADIGSLGYREDTVIIDDERDECVGTLVYHHDYSFENGYCWGYGGLVPPYYGALAEGFDLGAVTVECGNFWFTGIGYMYPDPTDIYVWDGGVDGPPSGVLCMVPGVIGVNVGYWPDCNENNIEIGCCVSGDFAVGYWQPLWAGVCPFYCCADENGPGGHPWTCIAPGIGYPSGWQNPDVVWPDCVSLGIGATIIEGPSPAESRTWGAVKALFD